jgi:O-antigen ligase
VSDQRFAWVTALMMYVLFFYTCIPTNLLDPSDTADVDITKPNLFYRTLKIALLVSGIVVLLWRRALAGQVARNLNIFFTAFIALVLLSFTWSIESVITLTRFSAICIVCLVCAAFVLVGWRERRFQDIVLRFMTALCVGSLIFIMVMPDLAKEHGTTLSLEGAWHGLLSQKNGLGHAASITVFFWVHSWLAKESKFLPFVLGCGAGFTCLILSHSSTSLFATFFAVALLLLLLKGPQGKRRYMVFIVVAFVATILLYSLAVLNIIPGLDVILQPIVTLTGKDMTFSGRTQIWAVIRQHIAERPLLGTGYGAYWIGRVRTSPSYVFITRLSNFYPTEAHNGYLDIINDLGYVGLTCLLGYVVVFLRQSLALLKVDYVQASLYLALLFEELINNLSESDWLSISSTSFVVVTLATFALARTTLEHRWRAQSQQSGALQRRGRAPGWGRPLAGTPQGAAFCEYSETRALRAGD